MEEMNVEEQVLPAPDAVCEEAPTEAALEPSEEKPCRPKGKLTLWLEAHRGGPLPLLLSFLLPFCIFTLCLAFQGVYPFGNEQIINYDGWHQYYPFVLKLWDHFHEGTGLLYDWSMGMGTNFLSMLSYYGSSPFNLLLYLVPVREFRLLFMLFTPVRIGLAGLFCALFLKKTVKNPGWSISFFSLGYALSGYILGYYWNNMWLDTVALFPLLCLALIVLFREGKSSLYVAMVALSLFSNYYIGYMSCMFVAIAFFILCFLDRVRFSDFLRKGFRLLLTTVLGAGVSAVLLLPAFFGLLNTASTQDAVGMYVSFYESIRDLVTPLASFHAPSVIEGLPNLATTGLLVLFAFAFLWAKRIGFREKLAAFFLLVFLVFSMNFSVINYIWHGFHYTNMIPYRFAFIFAFVIVVMAYHYYKKAIGAFDWIDAVGMLLFAVLIAFCAFGYYETGSILATVAVFAVGVILCAFYTGNLIPRRILSFFVCAIILVEIGAAAWMGTRAVGTTSYGEYYDLKIGEEITALVDEAEKKEKDGEAFYRLETTEWRSLNDSCFYDYNGISQFSSSANRDVSAFLLGLGMPADPGSNRFVYVHGTPLSNTLLGVKYLITKEGYLSDPGLRCISASSNDSTCALYEDTAFSGLGFMIDARGADFQFDSNLRPYQRQNALFSAITGLEGDLFSPIYSTDENHTNLTATRTEEESFDFVGEAIPEGEDTGRVLRFTYTAPEDGLICVYADVPMANYMQVNNSWHCIEDYPNLYSAGYFSKGEIFHLRTVINGEGNSEISGTASYDVLSMNTELWEEGLALLQDEKMEILSMEDAGLEAKVNAKTAGYLYTSIPAEKEGSWELFVDGKKEEITPFAGTFIGVFLEEGEHRIRLSYSPLGYEKGLWISVGSLLLLAALWVWERKGGKLFPEKPLPPAPVDEEGKECETENSTQGEDHDHTETDEHHPEGDR